MHSYCMNIMLTISGWIVGAQAMSNALSPAVYAIIFIVAALFTLFAVVFMIGLLRVCVLSGVLD